MSDLLQTLSPAIDAWVARRQPTDSLAQWFVQVEPELIQALSLVEPQQAKDYLDYRELLHCHRALLAQSADLGVFPLKIKREQRAIEFGDIAERPAEVQHELQQMDAELDRLRAKQVVLAMRQRIIERALELHPVGQDMAGMDWSKQDPDQWLEQRCGPNEEGDDHLGEETLKP